MAGWIAVAVLSATLMPVVLWLLPEGRQAAGQWTLGLGTALATTAVLGLCARAWPAAPPALWRLAALLAGAGLAGVVCFWRWSGSEALNLWFSGLLGASLVVVAYRVLPGRLRSAWSGQTPDGS